MTPEELTKIWVVCSGTQEVNLVARVFATEEEAQAHAATAREWHARHSERMKKAHENNWMYGGYEWYSKMFPPSHRADLVDEIAASSIDWPFGEEPWSEFWTVEETPFGRFNP